MKDENIRLRQVIEFLKENRAIRNQQELVELLDYDRSTLSDAKNGKVDVPDRLFLKINEKFPCISLQWMLHGTGAMTTGDPILTKNPITSDQMVTMPADVWRVIQLQAESLKSRDRQVDILIEALTEKKSKTA